MSEGAQNTTLYAIIGLAVLLLICLNGSGTDSRNVFPIKIMC